MASDVTRKAPYGSLVKVRTEKEQPKPVPIRRIGKRGQAWLKFRQQWMRDNPPDWIGNYQCAIGGEHVPASIMQLDHVLRRGSHPDRVLDKTNVRPVCPLHNQERER